MTVGDFTRFDKMITPTLIQILFYVLVAIHVLLGLFMLTRGGGMALFGLLIVAFGILISRVYCELLIVIFKIHSELVKLNQGKDASQEPAAPRQEA